MTDAQLRGVTDAPEWWRRLEQVHGRVAFDVGANGGTVARLLATRFERIYAFEPAEDSFRAMLVDTPPNVTPMMVAISDHDGDVALREADTSIRTGQLVTGDFPGWGQTVGTRVVPCRTLDSIVAEIGEIPDLVKVDVEGHEVSVLEGAAGLIRLGVPWMIEVHHASYADEIGALLRGYIVERVRHTGYPAGSFGAKNHFYVQAVPASP